MIFRKGSLTALIETESTVLGIRTHVGTVAGVYVYCPMAATNTVCCWCRSLEMLRISGPDLDSNNVPMLLQSVSLVSVSTIYRAAPLPDQYLLSTPFLLNIVDVDTSVNFQLSTLPFIPDSKQHLQEEARKRKPRLQYLLAVSYDVINIDMRL